MILQDLASLSRGTIRQVLHREGYHGRVSRRKPYISKANKLKCLQFAKHVNYPESFWKNLIFSDEIKINLFGVDGKEIVWGRLNAEFHKIHIRLYDLLLNNGRLIMIQDCMATGGTGNIEFIEETVEKMKHLGILK